MKIKILSKSESLDALNDKSFLAIWEILANQQDGITLNQEHDFVASWYSAYSEKCQAMMVVGYDNKGHIAGILPLAIVYETGEISHAGEGKAEYHGWICKKDKEEEFLVQVLLAIKNKLNPSQWSWGWLPPTANTQWAHSDILKKEGIYINLSHCDSPINKLNDTARLNKIKKHRSLRTQVNKLNKSGELRLERITDKKTTANLLDRIINQCNFRNLALYNYLPFDFDLYRKNWLLNHINTPNNIHFTVLWQGDNILASNYGYCDEETVILGLLTHDPSESTNSPGSIFLIKLMEFIKEESYQYLDITPGGDVYKERFCNAHNKLTKPTICFNQYANIKHRVLSSSRAYLKNKSNGRFTVRDIANIKMLLEKNFGAILKRKFQQCVQGECQAFLFDDNSKQTIDKSTSFPINIQHYSDLLLYQNKEGYLTQKEVASDALRKFQRGDTLYSMVSDGVLISYAWLAHSGRKHWHPCLKNRVNVGGKNSYIYDIYINQNYKAEEVFNAYAKRITDDITALNSSNIYLIKPLEIDASTLTDAGFQKPSQDLKQLPI